MAVLAKARRRSAGPAPRANGATPTCPGGATRRRAPGRPSRRALSPRRLVDRLLHHIVYNCFGRRRRGRLRKLDRGLFNNLGLRLRLEARRRAPAPPLRGRGGMAARRHDDWWGCPSGRGPAAVLWRAACRSRLRLCPSHSAPSVRTQRRRASQRWCSAADQP